MNPAPALLRGIRAVAFASVLAATAASAAERPPEAREALARGFAFAQEKQWSLAIKYFRTAQQAAPRDAAILLNLGLANQQVSGRDLVAAAWYRAFLAAAPQAREAAEVRRQLVKLEIANESSVQKLIEGALAVAQQWPEAKDKNRITLAVARARAAGGEASEAERLIRPLPPAAADWILAEIAGGHAEKANLDLAVRLAEGIKGARARAWALAEIGAAQAKRGDVGGAIRTAGKIAIASEAGWLNARIAVMQGRAGDLAGAEASAGKIAAKYPAHRAVALAGVALAAKQADLPWRIRGLIDEAAKLAGGAERFEDRLRATMLIARLRAEAGDIEGARAMAQSIPDGAERYRAESGVAQTLDDHANAEIFRWTAFALEAESRIGQGDIGALLKAAQDGQPLPAALSMAKAAEERARIARAYRAAP